jgi:hypothetical protein
MQAVFADIDIQRPKQQRASVAFVKQSALNTACWLNADIFRLTLLSVLLSLTANGTSFVVVKLQQHVVVAVDSASTLTSTDGKVRIKGPNICKILSADRSLWIVFSGDYSDPTTNIDFTHIALAASREKGLMKERSDSFERRAIWAANDIYSKTGRHIRIAVAFIGIGATEPFFYVRSFSHTPDGIHKDAAVDCDVGCDSWTAGGHTRQITLLATTYFDKYGLVKGAEDLVQAEIDADTTGEVRGPITVFEIGSRIAHFIRQGACHQ